MSHPRLSGLAQPIGSNATVPDPDSPAARPGVITARVTRHKLRRGAAHVVDDEHRCFIATHVADQIYGGAVTWTNTSWPTATSPVLAFGGRQHQYTIARTVGPNGKEGKSSEAKPTEQMAAVSFPWPGDSRRWGSLQFLGGR